MYWIAVGDVHESAGMLKAIPGVSGAEGLILSGDLTNRGREERAALVLAQAQAVNPNLLAQMGNMDHAEVGELLSRRGLNIHRQARLLAPGLVLMGVGWSTPTPFGTPSEVPDSVLADWLAETHERAQALAAEDCATCPYHLVAVIHTPPVNSALDRVSSGAHVGSAAVRAFIQQAKPDVVICGHIHEAVAEERLGDTHVLNPGLLAEGGYVRLSLTDGQLRASLERV
ncbi:MAG: metallophosphoesterase family protein [Humidesulfovibrio sp.]|uniref:metallophosphoesterase family protein n=1 Tax=Humidesulfovibrio sp. TaxID=2910988 RepID=UPI0027F32F61|nr:metallophosphoesterase family protein [Humidesulfovibrio sp.]MDQ7836089.1 metallophosphoesterase family protein [Humidesulfovibrio sp.]